MGTEAPQRRQVRAYGRVQGVGFRQALREEAANLQVTGWVRNRSDGSVEAMLQGSAEAVDALLAWIRVGPPGASVERVDVAPDAGEHPGGEHHGFAHLPTE